MTNMCCQQVLIVLEIFLDQRGQRAQRGLLLTVDVSPGKFEKEEGDLCWEG